MNGRCIYIQLYSINNTILFVLNGYFENCDNVLFSISMSLLQRSRVNNNIRKKTGLLCYVIGAKSIREFSRCNRNLGQVTIIETNVQLTLFMQLCHKPPKPIEPIKRNEVLVKWYDVFPDADLIFIFKRFDRGLLHIQSLFKTKTNDVENESKTYLIHQDDLRSVVIDISVVLRFIDITLLRGVFRVLYYSFEVLNTM